MKRLVDLSLRKLYFKPWIIKISIISFCFTSVVSAQDVQHSLYQYNPLSINSSNTGNFTGNWRIAANFRNQWVGTSEPFRTSTVSFDGNIPILRKSLGVGIYFMNDESGVGGINYNKIYASFAYALKFGDNYLRIGVQPGYVFAAIDSWNNWDHESGTYSASSQEINFGETTGYLDMNAGINWRRKFGKVEAQAGLSFQHLNKPNISFFEGDANEDMITILDASAKIDITEKIKLQPMILLFVKPGISLTAIGAAMNYGLPSRSSVKEVFVAVQIRNGILDELSSIALSTGLSMKQIDLAINYDMNIGNYSNAAGSTGAFEIALIYKNISTILNSYSIPCERY